MYLHYLGGNELTMIYTLAAPSFALMEQAAVPTGPAALAMDIAISPARPLIFPAVRLLLPLSIIVTNLQSFLPAGDGCCPADLNAVCQGGQCYAGSSLR